MDTDTIVQAQIDRDTQVKATAALEAMGLSVADAIRLLLLWVATEKRLPFALQVPNATVAEATGESKSGNGERPLQSLYGLWKDSGTAISPEEIDDLRREMWGHFPRDDT